MLITCGLLDLNGLLHDTLWERVHAAYNEGYRKRGEKIRKWPKNGWKFHSDADAENISIYCVGVWDTVGALGVPDDMALANLLDDSKDYQFHDTDISDKIEHARHAVALDEKRATFTPTLWSKIKAGQDVKQVWFPGVHADVGGGYPETGLSDGALKWMLDEASALGLEFHPDMVAQIRPDPQGVLHDSCTGVFKMLRTRPRSTPWLGRDQAKNLHSSVAYRRGSPPITQTPYRPGRKLNKGDKITVEIFAAKPWNDTGIYLERGSQYRFTTEGQWLDRDIKLGPEGEIKTEFRASDIAHLAGTLLGHVEHLFQKITGNTEADFRGTKREESMPWFTLVGVVANGGNPKAGGYIEPHESFQIGKGCHPPVKKKAGYLYCYANDAWHFYDNNHGSVMLTVERTK